MKFQKIIFNTLVVLLSVCATQAQTAKEQKRNTGKTTTSSVKAGRALFLANQCQSCHILEGKGCRDGVSLDKLPASRTKQFIIDQLNDPDTHVKKHAALFDFSEGMMPNPRLNKKEAAAIAGYILSVQKRKNPK